MSDEPITTTANNFELNKGDEMIFAFDISGSMKTRDCVGGISRFDHLKNKLMEFIVPASEYDENGVSFYAFNDDVYAHPDVASVEEVESMMNQLRPGYGTRTERAIAAAYAEHKEKGSEQTFLIIVTDGEPNDQLAVEKTIIDITKDVKDPLEFRIAILTVGKRSNELQQWLTDLDDNLVEKGAAYDILTVLDFDEVDFKKAIYEAIEG